jgi:hypothetical protein
MNNHEARLAILDVIRDVLLDLADAPADDLDVADAMGEAAELILEALGLQVADVDHPQVTCVLDSSSWDVYG